MKKMIVLILNLFLIGSSFAGQAWMDCAIQPEHTPSVIYIKHLYIRSNGDSSYSITSKDYGYENKNAHPNLTRDGLTFPMNLASGTVWMTLSADLKGVRWEDPHASTDYGKMEISCSRYDPGE
jgi:hypothetical protein